MANARSMVFAKLTLDIISAVLTFVVFFIYTFRYMDDYRIFMTQLEYQTSRDDIDYSVTGKFDKMCDMLRKDNTDPIIHDVCKHDDDFKTAGILFLTFSAVSLLLTTYNACNLLGLACGCTCFGIFKLKWVHFLVPLSQGVALVLYITVSRVFTLTTGPRSSSYEMKAGPGLVLMFVIIALELISAGYFIYALKNGIEDVLLVTQTGYRASNDSFATKPENPPAKSANRAKK